MRVEVLVAGESDEVSGRAIGPHAVTGLAVEAAQAPSDVGRHASHARQRVVQAAGVPNPELGELTARLQPAPLVAHVGFADADAGVETPQQETRLVGPSAHTDREIARANPFEAAGVAHVPHVGLGALLPAVPDSLVGGELGGVERRHHVRTVPQATCDFAMHAGPGFEPG